MQWYLVPALKQLLREANDHAPNRNKKSDGTIGDPNHASRQSDHNREADGSVDAIDLTHDPASDIDCARLAEHIRLRRDHRVKYLIWQGRWFRAYGKDGVPSWTWTRYTGPNPHNHHMHVSVLDQYQDQTMAWFDGVWTQAQEVEVTPQEREDIAQRAAALVLEGLVGTRGVLAKGTWNPTTDASLLEWTEDIGGNVRAIKAKVGA